jgi:hypothetical protein|nr:MAG TPA: peptidase [Caudoviricetes sp.]
MILGREDLKPFKAWFQKTLPLAYDDSLTYQELLYKLIAKINEVVESQNQTNENFDELYALFIQLKEYVDNYFKNLDVQEEINNKLDEMAKDGTLDKIINEQIFGELNDRIDKLEKSGGVVVSVKKWGAVGDGVTDDTTAFITCFNEITENNILYIPHGIYVINGTHEFLLKCPIIGDNATFILVDSYFRYNENCSVDGITFNYSDKTTAISFKSATPAKKVVIRNCNFVYLKQTPTNRNAVAVRVLSEISEIENIEIIGYENGVIYSNVVGLDSKYNTINNIFGKNIETLVDVEGYTNATTATGSLKNFNISNIVLENTDDELAGITNTVGCDCLLFTFVDNFTIQNITSIRAKERAIYLNTCTNGTITNVYNYYSDNIKIAGQNNVRNSYNIRVSNILTNECYMGSIFDVYDANNIFISNFSSINNVETDSLIRVRGKSREIFFDNGEIYGSYRGIISFEYNDSVINELVNINFNDIVMYNIINGKVDYGIVNTVNSKPNWLYNLTFNNINVEPQKKYVNTSSNISHFINISDVDTISVNNCVIKNVNSSANILKFTGCVRVYLNNCELYGYLRMGYNGLGSVTQSTNVRLIEQSVDSDRVYTGVYYAEFVNEQPIGHGHGTIRCLTNTTQYFLPTSGTFTCVLSGTKNSVFRLSDGNITHIDGDNVGDSHAGLNIPSGSYTIELIP